MTKKEEQHKQTQTSSEKRTVLKEGNDTKTPNKKDKK